MHQLTLYAAYASAEHQTKVLNKTQVKRYSGMGHIQMMDVNALGHSAIDFYEDVATFLRGVFGNKDGKQEE